MSEQKGRRWRLRERRWWGHSFWVVCGAVDWVGGGEAQDVECSWSVSGGEFISRGCWAHREGHCCLWWEGSLECPPGSQNGQQGEGWQGRVGWERSSTERLRRSSQGGGAEYGKPVRGLRKEGRGGKRFEKRGISCDPGWASSLRDLVPSFEKWWLLSPPLDCGRARKELAKW